MVNAIRVPARLCALSVLLALPAASELAHRLYQPMLLMHWIVQRVTLQLVAGDDTFTVHAVTCLFAVRTASCQACFFILHYPVCHPLSLALAIPLSLLVLCSLLAPSSYICCPLTILQRLDEQRHQYSGE
jgi:hypothetical protein